MTKHFNKILALLCVFLFSVSGYAQLANNIVPKPQQVVQLQKKPVEVNSESIIYYDTPYSTQASLLKVMLRGQTGLELRIKSLPKGQQLKNAIILQHDPLAANRKEMYVLESGDEAITVKAQDVSGMVYGIQSLLQLVPLERERDFRVEPVKITDYPQFAYRGMHLDVVRHTFPLDYIKKYIDYLAFHKFNNFHWHLTDD
jgi:hexosaminidase